MIFKLFGNKWQTLELPEGIEYLLGINMEGVPKTIHLSRILHFEPYDLGYPA
jgi:hypothetical protein